MSGFPEILVALIPFAAVGALVSLAGRAQARRARRVARQVALTDAIHRELGAAAAPEVADGARGGFVVRVAVPLHQEALVASLARITHELFERLDGPGGPTLHFVVEDRGMAPRRIHPAAPRPVAAAGNPGPPRRLHAA